MTPFVKLWSRSRKRQQRQPLKQAGRPREFMRPALEILEDRTLLSVVNWINPDDGNWDDPVNWSTGNLPGSGDDVVISTSSAATIIIQSDDNLSVNSLTTAGDDTLSITGGQLLLGDNSTLSGALSMTGGTLTASGSGITVTASGPTSISTASLYAQSGATLDLPELTSYSSNNTTFQADGTDSVLNVSALTTLTQQGSWNVNAQNGGSVNLNGLVTLDSTQGITVNDTGGGTLLDGSLTGLAGVNVTLDGSDAHVADSWASFTIGNLTVKGGANSLAGLTDVDGSSLDVNGGSLSLPGLTSYSSNSTTFQADGTDSVLDVSALTTLTQQGSWNVNAQNGGTVNLNGLGTLGSTQGISFNDTTGGTLLDGKLTTLSGVSATLDGTDPQVANSWTSFTGGGTLGVTGGSYVLPSLTDVDGSGMYTENGGSLALPGLTSYVSNQNGFQAYGAGSVLDLSALTTVTQQGFWTVEAVVGGAINLSGLTSLTSTNGLISINDREGAINLSNLTTLSRVSVLLQGTDPEAADSWTSFTLGTLTVSGGSYVLSGLTDVDDSGVIVQQGGSLALPGVTSYGDSSSSQRLIKATGTGSVLDLSALTSVTQFMNVDAESGGEIKLSGLTSLTNPNGCFFTDNGGSTILDGNLTTLSSVSVTLDGTDPQVANSWTSFTGASFTLFGGSYVLPGLTDVDDSTFQLYGGSLALPGVTSYVSYFSYFEALGAGSVLDFSALATVTQSGPLTLDAQNGGELKLAGLPDLGTSGNGVQVAITATGPGSEINFGSLTAIYGNSASLQVTSMGTILAPNLITLQGVTVTDDGTGMLNIAAILFVADTPPVAFAGSPYSYQFQATGTAPVTYSVAGLPTWAQLNAATGFLSGTPPAAGTFNFSVTASNAIAPDATANISLIAQLVPPTFSADSPPVAVLGSPYSYQFQATGTSPITYSAMGLPSWAQLNPATGDFSGTPTAAGADFFSVTASNGIAPDSTVDVSLIISGGAPATFNIPANFTVNIPTGDYAGGTIFDVGAGAIVAINGGTFAGGSVFDVGAGASVSINGGTFAGGMVFSVAQGATADLTGGNGVTYSGLLTGSGAGTVQLSAGTLIPGTGGVTMNFPGAMFQWTGGGIESSLGDVTNLGTINLAGGEEKAFYNDGTLDDFGSIVQSGSGNLALHSDNVTATTLKIEPGASYLIESDSGIDTQGGGQTALVNAGLLRKSGGTGTSTLLIPGSLTNTGTIEADSGTLNLDANSIIQISGGTLAGGTWNALGGATLQFPVGTSVTTNSATIALAGSGAAISGISGLSVNSGNFGVTAGATFTTTGDLSNSGSLTVGAGSTLRVPGNFMQTSGGAVDVQIGDTPASGQFGQIAVTSNATLAGAFNLAMVNGFGPAMGQDFPVLSFAGASGAFATINGLSPFFNVATHSNSFDLVDGSATAVDLAATGVTAPTTGTQGQPITVNWIVSDAGSQAASGSWQDSVYLSATPAITAGSVLLGAVAHDGGMSAGGSYNASLTAAVPALAPANYYVLVQVDGLYQVPDPNRANNTLAATTEQVNISLPVLTLGTPHADSFTAADQDHYYQITVPAGGSLNVALQSSASSGSVALYVSQGTLPTLSNYQQVAATANRSNQTAVVPQVLTLGTYYILAHSISGAAATAGFTITVTQTAAVTVSASSPGLGGNTGNVTVEIDGTNFTPSATASLKLGSTTITASSIDFVNASQLFATFNLAGAAVGAYALAVQQGSQLATAPSTFQVVAANAGSLDVVLSTPQYVRSGRTGTIVITYNNQSDNDIVVPLL